MRRPMKGRRCLRISRVARSTTTAPLLQIASPPTPSSSASSRIVPGPRAVTSTISIPAAVALRTAAFVRSEKVPSLRRSVPSRSIAANRTNG